MSKIKSILAFAAVLLCGGAWAVNAPIVVWDGDMKSAATKTGFDGQEYTLALNGNEYDGECIKIKSGNTVGAKITIPADKGVAYSVVVKYSELSGSNISGRTAVASVRTNLSNVQNIGVAVSDSNLNCVPYWHGGDTDYPYNSGSVPVLTNGSGYFQICFRSAKKWYTWAGNSMSDAGKENYNGTGLAFTANIEDIFIGGPSANSDTAAACVGLKIEAIALYKSISNDRVSISDTKYYAFPSDASTSVYAKVDSAAVNSSALNWKTAFEGGEDATAPAIGTKAYIQASADTTITFDQAFAASELHISGGHKVTFAATNIPTIGKVTCDDTSTIKFTGGKGTGTDAWVSPVVGVKNLEINPTNSGLNWFLLNGYEYDVENLNVILTGQYLYVGSSARPVFEANHRPNLSMTANDNNDNRALILAENTKNYPFNVKNLTSDSNVRIRADMGATNSAVRWIDTLQTEETTFAGKFLTNSTREPGLKVRGNSENKHKALTISNSNNASVGGLDILDYGKVIMTGKWAGPVTVDGTSILELNTTSTIASATLSAGATLKLGKTTSMISGDLTIADGAVIGFPEGTTEGTTVTLCSGTLTPPTTTEKVPCYIGSTPMVVDLTYNIESKTVSYSKTSIFQVTEGETYSSIEEVSEAYPSEKVSVSLLSTYAAPITIPANVTVEATPTAKITGAILGSGTYSIALADAGNNADINTWFSANQLTDFAGKVLITQGRFNFNTAQVALFPSAVTIATSNKGKIYLGSGEWNNHFVIAGNGWTGDGNLNMGPVALRVDNGTFGASASIEVVVENSVVPAIGIYNTNPTLCAITGTGGVCLRSHQAKTMTISGANLSGLSGGINLVDSNVMLAIDVADGETATVANNITGSGTVKKTGEGTLTFSSNEFNHAIVLAEGAIVSPLANLSVSGADSATVYKGTVNGNTTYFLTAPVATVGEQSFRTLAEAVSAGADQTVTLMVDEDADVTVPAGVTLDIGSHTIRGTVTVRGGALAGNGTIGNLMMYDQAMIIMPESGNLTVSSIAALEGRIRVKSDSTELMTYLTAANIYHEEDYFYLPETITIVDSNGQETVGVSLPEQANNNAILLKTKAAAFGVNAETQGGDVYKYGFGDAETAIKAAESMRGTYEDVVVYDVNATLPEGYAIVRPIGGGAGALRKSGVIYWKDGAWQADTTYYATSYKDSTTTYLTGDMVIFDIDTTVYCMQGWNEVLKVKIAANKTVIFGHDNRNGDTTRNITSGSTITVETGARALFGFWDNKNNGGVPKIANLTINGEGTWGQANNLKDGVRANPGSLTVSGTVTGTAKLEINEGDEVKVLSGGAIETPIKAGSENKIVKITTDESGTKTYTLVDAAAEYNGVKYATLAEAIAAAVGDEHLDQITILDPTAEVPQGYRVKDGKVMTTANYYSCWSNTANAAAIVNLKTTASFYDSNFAVFYPETDTESSTFNGNSAGTPPFGGLGNLNKPWNIFATKINGGNNSAYIAPGVTLRFTGDVTGALMDASFAPLSLAGLIVEPGATGFGFKSWNMGSNRGTELGAPNATTHSFIGEDFSIYRAMQGLTIKGTHVLEIDTGKTLHLNDMTVDGHNYTVADYKTVIESGACLKLAGSGTLSVGTLDASGATLDLSETTETITGNLRVDDTTKLVLPSSVEADEEFVLCTGTLTAPAFPVSTTMMIDGEETTVRLTYNAANKSVSYAVDSTVYWTPNTAALDNGILDWTATGAWLAADGITTKSWTEATASTCVRIDAAQVAGVKITGKVTVPEVIVSGTLASPNSFEFHNHTLDVAKDPTTGKDPTTDEEIDCLTVTVVNLSEYTGNLGLKVPIKGQINFGTGTHLIFKTGEAGGDASNAYSYKIVGRAGAIEVAGSGKFQVPSTMYDIPFAPNADATIVYNVADDTEKSVTSPLYNNQGSILKTGAGTLTLTSNIASGVTVTAGEGTLKFTTVGNYEMKGKLVVLSGATLVSTKTDAIGIDTDNVRVDVYGTLDMNGTRWTLSRDHTNDIYFYPGSKVVGLGEGANGAFDNARANKTNLHFVKNEDGTGGTVIFNTEIRFRSDNGYNAGMKIEEDMTVDYVNTVGFRSNSGTLNLTGGGVFNIAAAANITNLSKVKLGLGMTLNVAAGKTVTVEPIDSAAHGIVVIPNQDGSKTYKVAIPSPTTEWGSNDNRSVYLPINDEPSIYVFAGMTLDDIVSGKYELSTWMAGELDRGNPWLKTPCAGTIFWTDNDTSDKTVVFQSQCRNGTTNYSLVQRVELTEVELGGNTYIKARDLGQFYVSGANAYKSLIEGPGTASDVNNHYIECVRLTLTEYITDGTTLSAESLLQPEGGLRIAPSATVTIDGAGAVITPNMELSDGAKLVIDPVRTPMLVNSKVAFGTNAKLSLASDYASVTCGKMTLFTYPTACTIDEAAITAAIVDADSFGDASYTVEVENSPKSGYKRVVLTIGDYASVPETTFLPLGDSITEGYDDGVGVTGVPNYRVPLMEMLAAHGYKPVTRGYRTTNNQNAINMTADAAYQNHCGMVGHRILTGYGHGNYPSYSQFAGGYLQGIENYLAQAGEVDYITLLIGTNDIERSPNGAGSDEARQSSSAFIFDNWKTLIKRVVKQNPTSRIILTTLPANSGDKETLTQLVNAKIQAYIGSAECIADGITNEQVTLIDLHTACAGQFITASPLHPNWNGHIKNAAAWFAGIKTAEAKSFVKDATKLQTKTGIANTIPSTYTKGYVKLAEVDVKNIAKLSSVADHVTKIASKEGKTLTRVGYYVESQFANQAQTAYLWVDMPVWGEGNATKTLADVSVPTTETGLVRDVVDGIHVYSAGAGVENVEPTDDSVKGIVVRTIKGLNAAAGTVLTAKGEPTPSAAVYDWNDSANAAANWGAWQVFRINTAETGFTSASTLFTFGSYNANNSGNDFGIGDLAKHSEKSSSMSWIDTGARYPVLSAGNRAVAKIEIWGKIEGAVIPEADEAVVVEAETEEEALEQTDIIIADEAAEAAGQTVDILKKVATDNGNGTWSVRVELDAAATIPDTSKTVQAAVEETAVEFANQGLEAVAGATEETQVSIPAAKVVPGLYYSVSFGTTPDNHTQESERVLATGSNVTIPVPALGNEKVYYIKIKASATK